jgi:hypothetical protein
MYVCLTITWLYRLLMSQKGHLFVVLDVSNGDTRFLLLLIVRVMNIINENRDFGKIFFRFYYIKKKENRREQY